MIKQKKILIVEDNEAEALAFREMVEQGGYLADMARDGVEGLAKIRSKKPDLVLLDIMLPKMNGLDVLSYCKKDDQIKDIPIIILTNLTQGDEADKSFSLGAADHMVKTSVSPPEILNKIKKFIGSK